jgi:hypothetical protein
MSNTYILRADQGYQKKRINEPFNTRLGVLMK